MKWVFVYNMRKVWLWHTKISFHKLSVCLDILWYIFTYSTCNIVLTITMVVILYKLQIEFSIITLPVYNHLGKMGNIFSRFTHPSKILSIHGRVSWYETTSLMSLEKLIHNTIWMEDDIPDFVFALLKANTIHLLTFHTVNIQQINWK